MERKREREELFVRYSFGEYNNRIYKNLLVDQSSEKILILGDLFTFGWLLNDEDTFVYNLQKKFINKFFLNSASGGWGTADHLKYLQMYCKKINPKEVWIFVNNSDIDRSIRSNLYDIDNDRKLIELNPKLSLSQKIKVLANSVSFYNFLLENFHSIQLIRIFFTQTPEHNTTFNKKHKFFNDPNSFGKILFIELKKKTELCKSDLKIFYISWPILEKSSTNTQNFINLTEKENFYSKNDIKFYNLKYSKHMADVKKNVHYYSLNVGHPNKLGNEKIFLSVLDVLK